MQLAVQHVVIVHQMDVKTTYLNASIDSELYVEQPEDYEIRGEQYEMLVWRLKNLCMV